MKTTIKVKNENYDKTIVIKDDDIKIYNNEEVDYVKLTKSQLKSKLLKAFFDGKNDTNEFDFRDKHVYEIMEDK